MLNNSAVHHFLLHFDKNILEVNLSAFIYRQFHEDFSSIIGRNTALLHFHSFLSMLPGCHCRMAAGNNTFVVVIIHDSLLVW